MFTRHVRHSVLAALAFAAAATPSLWAQSGDPVVAQAPESSEPIEALERPARLSVRDVSLGHALTRLYEGSGVPVSFSPSLLPRTRVTCDCDTIPVARALEIILGDSGLRYRDIDGHVLVYRPGPLEDRTGAQVSARYAALGIPDIRPGLSAPSVAMRRQPAVGTIIGTVTESGTDQPVRNAQVAVDGAGRTLTDAQGRYRVGNVPVGQRSVGITSIGYTRVARQVAVTEGSTVTVDFALEVSPSQLDAVVATVTGDQRVRELGHVVGRINADSLMREAPISNISQLLTGRVAGLQVFQSSGIVGGDVQLQVRTPNTMLLGTQPIVIVDGVRYTNTAARDPARDGNAANPSIYGRTVGAGPAQGHEVTSPLNDLNPNDIERIEVVKGPTAVTLYGTDAANGVLVITTKRGRAGPARWNAYARSSLTEPPSDRFPEQYFAWGTAANGQPFGNFRNGRFIPANCHLSFVALGACAQDSIVRLEAPIADPDLTIFHSAPQWTYGMNVSGGGGDVRYYLGASVQQETGPVRMPQALVDSMQAARGASLPQEQLRPNALTNMNLRSNLSASFGAVQLHGNLGYVRRRNRTFDNIAYEARGVPGFPWGTSSGQRGGDGPAEVFSRTSITEVDRFIGGARAEWQLQSWLQARASAGMDLGLGTTHSLMRRGETLDRSANPLPGAVQEEVSRQRATSADAGLTASLGHGRLTLRTSIGAQYHRSLNEIRISGGTDLVPGGESVTHASERYADRVYSETATLGTYAEQVIGLNGRLFFSGAVRVDGASNFGQKYQAAAYPKVGASWIVSEEPFMPRVPGLDELRMRYAFGASGQQAYPWMKLPTFATPEGVVEGLQVSVIDVSSLGNEHLRPERVSEHEYGFDVAALSNRVGLGVAWYSRRVVDQIVSLQLPPGLGLIYTNLGLTTARGFEATVDARVLDSRHLTWDLTFNHSSSSTLVVDLGDGAERVTYLGGFREGYPIGARFYREYLGFEDVNGDGIITSSELRWSDFSEQVYLGETIPPRVQSLHTTLGFLDRRIRASATFNRTAGHIRVPYPGACTASRCLPLLDPQTPVEEQAAAMVMNTVQASGVPADETRLTEVTLALDLPSGLLGRVGGHAGTVSVAARNLARWTGYPGEPGSVQVQGINTGLAAGIPQSRSWTVRFDIGF